MKYFVRILSICLLAIASHAQTNATVTGNLVDMFGISTSPLVTFTPGGPATIGYSTIIAAPRFIRPTGGSFTLTNVQSMVYRVTASGANGAIFIYVPPGTNTYSITDLSTNALVWRDRGYLSSLILPGTNIVFQTNNPHSGTETLTISSTASGGSNAVDPTLFVMATNGVSTNQNLQFSSLDGDFLTATNYGLDQFGGNFAMSGLWWNAGSGINGQRKYFQFIVNNQQQMLEVNGDSGLTFWNYVNGAMPGSVVFAVSATNGAVTAEGTISTRSNIVATGSGQFIGNGAGLTGINASANGLATTTQLTGFQPGNVKLTNFAALANGAGVLTNNGTGTYSWVPVASGGGGGSQTPILQDVDYAQHSATNINSVTFTNMILATGYVVPGTAYNVFVVTNPVTGTETLLQISGDYTQARHITGEPLLDAVSHGAIQFYWPGNSSDLALNITGVGDAWRCLAGTGEHQFFTPVSFSNSIALGKVINSDANVGGNLSVGTYATPSGEVFASGANDGVIDGAGTTFTSDVQPGDTIFAGGLVTRVSSVGDDTTLHTDGAMDGLDGLVPYTVMHTATKVDTTGAVTRFADHDTQLHGLPHVIKIIDKINQTAALGSNYIETVSTVDSYYRLTFVADINRAATSSSTLGPLMVGAVDANDLVYRINTNSVTSTVNGTNVLISGSATVLCGVGQDLSYQFGYASSGATSMKYNLHVVVERF